MYTINCAVVLVDVGVGVVAVAAFVAVDADVMMVVVLVHVIHTSLAGCRVADYTFVAFG